jgi:hypothetical protein
MEAAIGLRETLNRLYVVAFCLDREHKAAAHACAV